MPARLDLTPSPRAHGAQRMITMTVLVIEALVLFFAVLVAHQLADDQRLQNWTWGLLTAGAMLLVAGLLKRGSWPYLLGAVLQIPLITFGMVIPAMWVLGIGFAILYVYGSLKGNQLDREKDAVDARVHAAGDSGPEPD